MIEVEPDTQQYQAGKEGEREEDWDKDDVLSSGGSCMAISSK